MGRFYFHIREAGRLIPDDEGTDLPDFPAARREALLSARELLAEAIKKDKPEVPDAFVIADEVGHTLETLSLNEILPKQFRK
jgi:hypothetical protein